MADARSTQATAKPATRKQSEAAGPHNVQHPFFAWLWTRLGPMLDRAGLAEYRKQLLAGIHGRVLEVGAGSGLNFPHYPYSVTGVLAIEPEPSLAQYGAAAAGCAPVPVELVAGTAESIPSADASFDAAVTSLVLCSVSDQRAALAELHRVLRPGGKLFFLEHVRAETPGLRHVQAALDATLWPVVNGGCHTSRDTAAAIEANGFRIDRLTRLRFPDTTIPSPSSPHILGIATRTGGD
ncbi:class I SAM-dependent methyltransferase [Actinopolymorpha pittospori]